MTGGGEPAGLARRLGASVYEALLLAALCLGIGFALLPVVTPLSGGVGVQAVASPAHYLMPPGARALSGTVLFAACGAYCVWLWSGGRRTLPMQTWRLRLRSGTGLRVAPPTALLRYVACWLGPALAVAAYGALQPTGNSRWVLILLGLNYAWAFFDRDRQFLQDRIAGTRLVVDPAPTKPAAA